MTECEHLPDSYRLTGGTVVDPARRSVSVVDVTVAGDQIAPADDADEGENVIPVRGLFLLPGLIDMHVHLVPSLADGRGISDEVLNSCKATLNEALDAGITSVRDLGGDFATLLTLRAAQEAGTLRGSRVFVGGPAICPPGGHGMHSGHGIAIAEPDDAHNVVEGLAQAGADHVKLITSGARGQVQLRPDVMRSAVVAARTRELPVAVHAHFQRNQLATAIHARVRSIEHGFLLHTQPTLLSEMAATGIYLCPTLRVIESIRSHPEWYGQLLIPAAWPDATQTVQAARQEGIELLTGTDSGVYGVRPADVWREITLIARCVDSRWDGLRAATWLASRALGRYDLGRLDEGAQADIVVLTRNPLTTEVDERDVAAVIQSGRLVTGSLRYDSNLCCR